MEWIKVEDRLPEDDSLLCLSREDEMMPEMTKKVLVFTDTQSVVDNRRLKMQVGEKEWVWFMSLGDEEITHWALFEEPAAEEAAQ